MKLRLAPLAGPSFTQCSAPQAGQVATNRQLAGSLRSSACTGCAQPGFMHVNLKIIGGF